MKKKKLGVLKSPRKLTRKKIRIKLSEEEQICIVNQMAANEMSKVGNFVLEGRISEPTREEILEIEKIKLERDIEILKINLHFKKKRIKDSQKKI